MKENTWFYQIISFPDKFIRLPITKKVLIFSLAILVLKKTVNLLIVNSQHRKLMERARKKRLERDNKINEELIALPEVPQDIASLVLRSTISELIDLLNEEKITSEQILIVYYKQAFTLGLKLELIAESNFQESFELARKCDIIRKFTPKEERYKLGRLFGIPISIKDSIEQKGLDSTCGRAKSCFQPSQNDGIVITLLKAQGAIPFIRSNLSQILRAFDCSNNIWGTGLNPWNVKRTVGGSSGGDAGLIASKCSPISLGSDAYGSIRLPAAFTGVYGFKPTSGRCVQSGHSLIAFHDISKFSFLQASMGPIGRSTDDLLQIVKGLITSENRLYDPSAPFIAWNNEKFLSKEKLKVAYVLSEDFFEAAEPCKRAVKEAILSLEKLGHETVEIKIPHFEEISLKVIQLLTAEGKSRSLQEALGGEKPTKGLELFMNLGKLPNLFKKILKWFSSSRTRKILDHTLELSANDLTLSLSKLCHLRNELLKYWAENKFDVIITPAVALPAFKHNYGSKLLLASCYLWIANIINSPAGVVPITKVKENETCYNNSNLNYKHDILSQYSQECMEGSVGLPVGVQILTLPWEDEKCLKVMKLIEDEIKFYEFPKI